MVALQVADVAPKISKVAPELNHATIAFVCKGLHTLLRRANIQFDEASYSSLAHAVRGLLDEALGEASGLATQEALEKAVTVLQRSAPSWEAILKQYATRVG